MNIVLKLALPESQQGLLQRHPLLRSAESHSRERCVCIYYDTKRRALRKEGVRLRLTRQPSSWLQTVETRDIPECGLIRRLDWTVPYPNRFDFSRLSDTRLRDWLSRSKVAGRLVPVFETSFNRTIWQLSPSVSTTIRVMRDRGWMAADGRRSSVSDLTLELVTGDLGELYAVAEQLAERVLLLPVLLPEAEQGYRLLLDVPPGPVKAKAVPIEADALPMAVFRTLALSCLTHLHSNRNGAISGDDPEYVHQMRVATRRLRTVIRIFKPVLPDDVCDSLVLRLREVMNTLGRARDLDVVTAEIVLPVVDACPGDPALASLAAVVAERLYRARTEVVRALRNPDYGQHLLRFGGLLHRSPFVDQTIAGQEPLLAGEFAERCVKRLHKRALKFVAAASMENPTSLHELRISIKHLRHGMEFFGPVLPGKSGTEIIGRLIALQEHLGQINDLTTANTLLASCAAGDAELRAGAAVIQQWHAARHAALLSKLPSRIKKVQKWQLHR